ncbi:hypothetical protein ACVXG7_25550 [Enterobacter hormaechei]
MRSYLDAAGGWAVTPQLAAPDARCCTSWPGTVTGWAGSYAAPRRHTAAGTAPLSACLDYRHPARPSRWISSLGHAATGSTTKRWTGLASQCWQVSPQSNRIGLRLQGDRLHAVTTANYQ